MSISKSLGLFLSTSFCLVACPQNQDAELAQALQAVTQMSKARALEQSCFYVVHPNGQPSDFVNYLFSDLGVAEWPIALEPDEAEGMKAAGITPLPDNVLLNPHQRQNRDRKELILIADDATGQIQVSGYLVNQDEPNLQADVPLAEAPPNEFTQQICQSALESGIDPGIEPTTPAPNLAP